MVEPIKEGPQRALSPLDYQELLVAHDPSDPYAQPHADFWRWRFASSGRHSQVRSSSGPRPRNGDSTSNALLRRQSRRWIGDLESEGRYAHFKH